MNCPNCGNPVSNAAAFCSCCGEKIEFEPNPDYITDELPTGSGQTDGQGKPKNKTKKSGAAKVLAVLLCAAVIVAVSVFGTMYFLNTKDSRSDIAGTTESSNTTENSNTTVSQTISESLTYYTKSEYNIYDEHLVYLAEKFILSLVDKNFETTIDLLDVTPIEPDATMKAYAFLKTVDITDYEFVESRPSENIFLIWLDISKSGSEMFPVGSALWNLEVDGLSDCITLFKPVDKAINLFYAKDEFPPESEAAHFCLEFSEQLGVFETTDNFNTIVPDADDINEFGGFCLSLAEFLNVEDIYEVKRVDLEHRAKNALGITDIDFTKCKVYQSESDTLSFGGRGGTWLYCTLSSERYNPLTKRHTVVIDYCSDSACILKAKTVRYIVKENDDGTLRLLSTKLLYDSGLCVSGGII